MSGSGLRFQILGTAGFRTLFTMISVVACIYISIYMIGWRTEIVLSGSMEPTIDVGELVVTRPISPEDVRVGDILTYTSTSGKDVICHRVVSIENTPSLRFITQGDANKHSDSNPLLPTQVIGIVCFHAPYLGYVLHFLKLPQILLAMIAILVFFALESKSTASHKSQK